MRRTLGTLALLSALAPLGLLAGCGAAADDPVAADPTPTDPTPTEPTEAEQGPRDAAAFEVRELVSGTAGGGTVAGFLTAVGTPRAAARFVADLSPALADDVRLSLAANPRRAGEQVYAAVVAVGCDVPPGVDVTETADGYAVAARKVADPLPECFAPVTTVAVVAVSGG